MRKRDSMQRDVDLALWHKRHGLGYPASGITQAFIEYDQGNPVGLVSYHRKGDALPSGPEVMKTYDALAGLYGPLGDALPFISVVYDPERWTYRLWAHNDPAKGFVSHHWHEVTEVGFATVLYAMRGRTLPDLSRYGVTWGAENPTDVGFERFPGQHMSVRRRNFEPEMQVRPNLRIPCVDIDLMVASREGEAGLLVEYKRAGARVDAKSQSLQAISSLASWDNGMSVPALVAQYEFGEDGAMAVSVAPLNGSARRYLADALGTDQAPAGLLAGGHDVAWVQLTEAQWLNVLAAARDL